VIIDVSSSKLLTVVCIYCTFGFIAIGLNKMLTFIGMGIEWTKTSNTDFAYRRYVCSEKILKFGIRARSKKILEAFVAGKIRLQPSLRIGERLELSG
jgi:hypothetical protein